MKTNGMIENERKESENGKKMLVAFLIKIRTRI
jgi:hypothetical protein